MLKWERDETCKGMRNGKHYADLVRKIAFLIVSPCLWLRLEIHNYENMENTVIDDEISSKLIENEVTTRKPWS